MYPWRRILIPTDMSEFGKLALQYGVLFQERLGAALTLMYADEFYFPVDLLEACLERVERLEPRVRAWVFTEPDTARVTARERAEELRRPRLEYFHLAAGTR